MDARTCLTCLLVLVLATGSFAGGFYAGSRYIPKPPCCHQVLAPAPILLPPGYRPNPIDPATGAGILYGQPSTPPEDMQRSILRGGNQ